MTANALTTEYLAEFTRRGIPPTHLAAAAAAQIDLAATSYDGRCLTRPVFLEHDEFAVMSGDLIGLHAALTSLPGRLFGGDLGAFAGAVGMSDRQVTAILRGRSEAATRLGRADLFRDDSAFRVMELNMGSAIGGLDNALLNEAFLTQPMVADFVAAHQLSYVDTMSALVDTLRSECGISGGEQPLIAAADWPESFATLEPQLRYSAEQLARYGLEDVIPCHVGQLSARDGRVWLDGRPVDVIYRIFLIEDLLQPEAADLIEPVLRAAERGEVRIFAPMDAELYGSKGALALLSDEANRHLFTGAELASLDRILPWTRMVRPGEVTLETGERADMFEYALPERENLVLKPTALHSGAGVVQGWLASPDEWKQALAAAMNGPYVLQHRIRPLAEEFPAPGGLEPWVLGWGTFLAAGGYGGAIVRGSTNPDVGVMNMPHGATATCAFQQAEAAGG